MTSTKESLLLMMMTILSCLLYFSNGFVIRNGISTPLNHQFQLSTQQRYPAVTLFMAEDEDRLRALGYSEDEIKRAKREDDSKEDIKVRVDLLPEVDAVSLTAVGFGLIALNFFVFANMGDGGISGFIAQIMNNM
jgi:hypothetical protein